MSSNHTKSDSHSHPESAHTCINKYDPESSDDRSVPMDMSMPLSGNKSNKVLLNGIKFDGGSVTITRKDLESITDCISESCDLSSTDIGFILFEMAMDYLITHYYPDCTDVNDLIYRTKYSIRDNLIRLQRRRAS